MTKCEKCGDTGKHDIGCGDCGGWSGSKCVYNSTASCPMLPCTCPAGIKLQYPNAVVVEGYFDEIIRQSFGRLQTFTPQKGEKGTLIWIPNEEVGGVSDVMTISGPLRVVLDEIYAQFLTLGADKKVKGVVVTIHPVDKVARPND